MAKLFIITARLSALRMKGGLVISSSNVQTASQKISKTSIPLVLLFLIFAVVLSNSSLSVDAVQTDAGNSPASGTISDNFIRNSTVISGTDSPFGGSVIYSVSPNTEYYIRSYVPISQSPSFYIHFFNSYPSLGTKATFYSNDFSRDGDIVTFHFTTSSSTSFVVLSFRFGSSYTDYKAVNGFIQSASIGRTLGLYSPLSNRSSAELTFGFVNPRELRLTLAGFGGVGDYTFTVDVNYSNNNSENFLDQVPSGNYTLVVPAFDDGAYLTITISDILTSITTKIVPVIPDINVDTIPPPDVDTDYIPETSISIDNGVADIIIDSFSVIPSEITALLIPVVLFSLIGWWLHK